MVRPEKLFLAKKMEKSTNLFSGVVTESIFQGESQLLVLKLEEKVYGNQSVQMRSLTGLT